MPGTPTPFYGFPIPAYTDPADGPDAISDLAQKVEDTLRLGYVMQGDLLLGETTSANARILMLRKLDGADGYQGQVYIMSGGALALVLLKNGTEVNRLRINPDGTVVPTLAGQPARPIPWATWCSRGIVVLTSAASGSIAITLPAGRFTAPAGANTYVSQATVSGSANYYAYITSGDNVSVTVGCSHRDATAGTANITVNVSVTQMTPTLGPG